jgi:hypothetical protein
MSFSSVVLGLECVTRGFLFGRQWDVLATDVTQAVGVAIGELGRDFDPLPAFGADCFRLAFELAGDEAIPARRPRAGKRARSRTKSAFSLSMPLRTGSHS